MQPVHQHDCERCRYIGTVSMPDGLYDWYVHRYVNDHGGHRDTLVARYGSDGPEYTTPYTERPLAVFEHVGSAQKSYSGNALIAYALGALGLLSQQGDSPK